MSTNDLHNKNMNKHYNAGLDTAAQIVEEIIGGTAESETILYGIESSKIDSENDYCEVCNSCGTTCCCNPIYCEAVKCKYGDINLEDYECFQNQWEIMHNALKELADFDKNAIAINALNAVDKEWDKLYSKE